MTWRGKSFDNAPSNLEMMSMSFGKETSGTPSSSVITRKISKPDGQRPSNCEMTTHQKKTHPEICSLRPVSVDPQSLSPCNPPSELGWDASSPSARVEFWRIRNEIWNEIDQINSRSTGWTWRCESVQIDILYGECL